MGFPRAESRVFFGAEKDGRKGTADGWQPC